MRRWSKRPLLAVILSILQPGIGHLYLGAWLRAALWAGLWLVPFGMGARTISLDPLSLDLVTAVIGVLGTFGTFPLEFSIPMVAVTLLATYDSYRIAERNVVESATPVCPQCGREVDPTIDFCHWCTSILEDSHSEG